MALINIADIQCPDTGRAVHLWGKPEGDFFRLDARPIEQEDADDTTCSWCKSLRGVYDDWRQARLVLIPSGVDSMALPTALPDAASTTGSFDP